MYLKELLVYVFRYTVYKEVILWYQQPKEVGREKEQFYTRFKLCLAAQLCPILCDSMDSSPPGSSAHEIFQARKLGWVAISYPRGSSRPRDWTHVSSVSCTAGRLFTSEPLGEPLYLS